MRLVAYVSAMKRPVSISISVKKLFQRFRGQLTHLAFKRAPSSAPVTFGSALINTSTPLQGFDGGTSAAECRSGAASDLQEGPGNEANRPIRCYT